MGTAFTGKGGYKIEGMVIMVSEEKAKIAFYWAASCGGCEIAILDLDAAVLDIAAKADIVFWPVAIDTKYQDIEAMSDKSIDVTFFNGVKQINCFGIFPFIDESF